MDDKELKIECLRFATQVYKPNHSAIGGQTIKNFTKDIISMAKDFENYINESSKQ